MSHEGNSNNNLQSRVAVVTGGSRGIGRGIALELARHGAFVVVNYLEHECDAARTIGMIEDFGGTGVAFRANVCNPQEVDGMFRSIRRDRGSIDILVNNAGITRDALFVMMPLRDWQEVMDTDLNAVFLCSKAVVRDMCAAKRGVIINIGSGSGISAREGQVNYSSAKSALIGYSRSLARELAPKGVRVAVVAPGFTATEMSELVPSHLVSASLTRIPLGRWGRPDELASVVAYLASDDAAFITGQTIVVDGGRSALEQEYGF